MKEKVIGTVECAGMPYTVVMCEVIVCDGKELLGQVDHQTLTILIKEGLPPAKFDSVMVHEYVHIISDLFDLGFDEHVTELLSNALYQCGFRVMVTCNPENMCYSTSINREG